VPALRFVSYLAPSLPVQLFAATVEHIARAARLEVELTFDVSVSAPQPGPENPFAGGRADFGFMCAPGAGWLHDVVSPIAAPLFDDPRTGGLPIYFADVVVAAGGRAWDPPALRHARWAYNDVHSLSGYLALRRHLGAGAAAHLRCSGSHLGSLELIARGEVDAAAIDSNVLGVVARRDSSAAARVRVVDSFGPFPVQPVVARRGLPVELVATVRAALLAFDGVPSLGLRAFAAADAAAYEAIAELAPPPAAVATCAAE
jgi:ABC-type phosphate/phosphonate transport system substrate-binding protein